MGDGSDPVLQHLSWKHVLMLHQTKSLEGVHRARTFVRPIPMREIHARLGVWLHPLPRAYGSREIYDDVVLDRSAFAHATYFAAVFRALWEGTNGVWSGQVRDGTAPTSARR